MRKQLGPILLIAGTCIGSGMIALPLVLAPLGLIGSVSLMLLIWFIMYYTSLVNLELNLQAGRGLSLGALGQLFSGRVAASIGAISLKLLSYALLAVFLYGGASILQKSQGLQLSSLIGYGAGITFALLLLPIKWIDYFNRCLFTGLLLVVALLILGLATKIDWTDLPLFTPRSRDLSVWQALVPVVFTSFGFQVIFHTLTNYCQQNGRLLKRAFLWGSLIPAFVYILWTCSVLCTVHHHHPDFYQRMMSGKAEIGDLIQTLCMIAKWPLVQELVGWISLLAIVTSLLGVGIGLCDTLRGWLSPLISHPTACRVTAAALTVLPPYSVALLVPNAFITVLGFAGMILTVIAVLLPLYLLRRAKIQKWHYPELEIKWLIRFSALAGWMILGCELLNLLIPFWARRS